jgi:hypothetical protein
MKRSLPDVQGVAMTTDAAAPVEVASAWSDSPSAPCSCGCCIAAQARIDSLMLEYCPDEMTEPQKARWAEHQAPAR